MGRNRKTGLDYFPFDVDTFQDIKIRKLIKYQSGKAVTVYALLLCFIYKSGYYMRWDEELPFIISEQTGFEEAYIQEVIKSCMVLGLFSKELFDKERVLTSKGIQERYRDICKQINRKCDFVEFSLISSEKKPISSEETGISSEEKPINSEESTQKKRKERENKKKGSNPPTFPPCGEEDAAKSWRDDFDVYKSELKETFDRIVADEDFIENRQKYHPNVDIRLSLQKAYEDYWNTEAGWKKKKSGRTKEIDWKATFRKALDQPQNRVYKQKDTCKPEPERAMSELQERFARYLEKEAPLLLDMPLQPSNEEVGILLKTNKNILRDIVKKINNDKYLTTHKNSVFQTIMELKQKEYGT